MINATFACTINAESSVDGTRTITGVAVPWNQVGVVSDGSRVRFHPGSLPVDARPTVVRGHEGMPIGRVSEASDTGSGLQCSVRVSRVRDGDEALILAEDGVLGMFSVGANPTEFSFSEDGVLDVFAAEWHHLALLSSGAFPDAVVTHVAAQQGETVPDLLTTDPPVPAVAAAPPAVPDHQPAVVPISASRPLSPPLTLARIATLVAQANRGEITTEAVRATIQAALTNVTTTNIGGIVPPAYRTEINGIIDHGTPLLTALSSTPLPTSGMSIEYPEWTALPTTGIQATEKTAIVSTAVTVALRTAPVITIAGGNDISLQAVERSSPSFLESYLRAASTDWGRKAEAYAISRLTAAAVVATPGANFLANVQALMAALDPALTPPGPLWMGMSYDVALPLISVTTANGPAFWSGAINFGSVLPEVNADGLNIFIDWNLPAKTMVMGSKQSATYHQSGPADIRVVDVSLLGLDVGVYGYVAVTVEYPKGIAVLTTA